MNEPLLVIEPLVGSKSVAVAFTVAEAPLSTVSDPLKAEGVELPSRLSDPVATSMLSPCPRRRPAALAVALMVMEKTPVSTQA